MPMFLTCQVKRISVAESLPNITGSFFITSCCSGEVTSATGVFKGTGNPSVQPWGGASGPNRDLSVVYDAKNSSTVYQDDASVKPNSLAVSFYIKH